MVSCSPKSAARCLKSAIREAKELVQDSKAPEDYVADSMGAEVIVDEPLVGVPL